MELLYYHTDLKTHDGAVTDDELTPVVLLGGKVIGWGWILLQRFRQDQSTLGLPSQAKEGPKDIRKDVEKLDMY